MESISFIWRKVINLYEPRLLTSVMVYNGVRGICPSDHNPTCTFGDAPRGIRTVLYFRNLDIYKLKAEPRCEMNQGLSIARNLDIRQTPSITAGVNLLTLI